MEEAVPPLEERPSGECYIEELAGPDDYWMTITDAARATRRQDITIRRWIASGQLPVRKQRVGLNRRSRQIRASDVAKLTPIVDTSAMISGEEARISLTNIPAEQAAIRADHQRLLAECAALREALAEQQQATEQALASQQESWQLAFKSVQKISLQRFIQQQQVVEAHRLTLERMRTDLLARLALHTETAQRQQQQLDQLQNKLLAQQSEFQSALQEQRHALDTLIAQQRAQTNQSIELLKASVAEANHAIARSTTTFSTQFKEIEQASLSRASQHAQEMREIKGSFQQEQEAVARQIAALATQIAEYQSNQEQLQKHTQAQFAHLQSAGASLRQEQAALAADLATLTAQFVEQRALQEDTRQQAEEQLIQLQTSLAALQQQMPEQASEQ